jgi:dihydrodipicolinate synthase/N-acetylneuraminate lyase
MAAGIGGVIGAPVTTFTSANTVDLDTTERICDFLVGHGVHELALPLHTGESSRPPVRLGRLACRN